VPKAKTIATATSTTIHSDFRIIYLLNIVRHWIRNKKPLYQRFVISDAASPPFDLGVQRETGL
jgi:hypothetical protein